MSNNEFIKQVEKMIEPIDVGTIHFMQTYMKSVPVSIQNKIIASSSTKNLYMPFIVEPYSFFLCYKIIDIDWAKSLLPDNYKLVETKIFESDIPSYYCILGVFNVRSSVFMGTRLEFYIIAENVDTKLMTWVIVDYDTNTVSFDTKSGLHGSTTKECIHTTDCNQNVITSIISHIDNKKLIVNTSLSQTEVMSLDQRLWLEGNLSIAYGKSYNSKPQKAFFVIFNPKEVSSGLKIPNESVQIISNTW